MDKNYVVPYIGIGSIWGKEEEDAVIKTFYNCEALSEGPERDMFEKEFAEFIGAKYAYSVTNCTIALEYATYLVGLKPGDEVIATPFSYQASIQPLLNLPIKVKFCDIDENTLCAEPKSIEALVTPNTRAIYLTHVGGIMADMDSIMEIADKHNLIVVEDCAHAHGSSYKGRKAGTTAHIGCYSFQSYKNMSTLGEGGMITFNNDKWATIIKRISSIEADADFVENNNIQFGTHKKPIYDVYMHEKNAYTHDCVAIRHQGSNSTMSEPAAAAGRVQLKKLKSCNSRREIIAKAYDDALSKIPEIRVQVVPEGYVHSHHLYAFFLNPMCGIDRDELANEIEKQGVQVVLRYFPLHLLPEWRYHGHSYGECPITEKIWFEQLINLPIYPMLTDEQIEFTISAVQKAIEKLRKK